MPIRQLVITGDSLTAGMVGEFSIAQGGAGDWTELVAESLGDVSELGPLISSGWRPTWIAGGTGVDNSWTLVGTWTTVASTDAFDRAPYGRARYANGNDKLAIFTPPSAWRQPVGYAIYYIDYSAGGNWQYQVNGGTWTAMGQTLANDNLLAKFYIDAPATVSAFSVGSSQVGGSDQLSNSVSIRFRGGDGSSSVGLLPVAVEVFYTDPRTAGVNGFIVHNIAANGMKLNDICASTSGDRLAFFDSVKLGSGSPISNRPTEGTIVMHINDVLLNSTSQWNTDLTTLYNRVSPFGPVGFLSPYECTTGFYNSTTQSNYRSQTKTTGTSLGVKVLDIYDEWAANGWTGNTQASSAGLLYDLTHESQAGHLDMGQRIFQWLRSVTQFLPRLSAVSPFVIAQSQVGGSDELGGHLNIASDVMRISGVMIERVKKISGTTSENVNKLAGVLNS